MGRQPYKKPTGAGVTASDYNKRVAAAASRPTGDVKPKASLPVSTNKGGRPGGGGSFAKPGTANDIQRKGAVPKRTGVVPAGRSGGGGSFAKPGTANDVQRKGAAPKRAVPPRTQAGYAPGYKPGGTAATPKKGGRQPATQYTNKSVTSNDYDRRSGARQVPKQTREQQQSAAGRYRTLRDARNTRTPRAPMTSTTVGGQRPGGLGSILPNWGENTGTVEPQIRFDDPGAMWPGVEPPWGWNIQEPGLSDIDYQPADPINPAGIPGGYQMNNAQADAVMRYLNSFRTQ